MYAGIKQYTYMCYAHLLVYRVCLMRVHVHVQVHTVWYNEMYNVYTCTLYINYIPDDVVSSNCEFVHKHTECLTPRVLHQ